MRAVGSPQPVFTPRARLGAAIACLLLLADCSRPVPVDVDTMAADSDGGAQAPDIPAVADAIDVNVGPEATADTDAVSSQICKINSDCPPSQMACTESRCDVAAGTCLTVHQINGHACDDGELCTSTTVCLGGVCQGGEAICGCVDDATCAKLDDDNHCNGTWFCNKSVTPAVCVPKPGSAVVCQTAGNPCAVPTCDSATGSCAPIALPDGVVCEDGLPCTVADHCQAGQCTPGAAVCACQADADCADDGNLCNGIPFCDKSGASWACALNPGSIVTCSQSEAAICMQNACDPTTGGCKPQPGADGAACEDGQACTAGSHCKAGSCQGGDDVCGCTQDSDCAPSEDGDACNGSLYCNIKSLPHVCTVNPATIVVCPSAADTACTKNACQPKTGQCAPANVADGAVCDDDNPCSTGDACQGGGCAAKGNVCACTNDSECAGSDDANLCNGSLYCDKSKVPYGCVINSASVVTCPVIAGSPCHTLACLPKTGTCTESAEVDGTACDADGNACTDGDVCQAGQCQAGQAICQCQKDADCGPWEDGDVCNGTMICSKASHSCVVDALSAVTCPAQDDSVCQVNQCQPGTGLCKMTPRNEGQSCDADGDNCTVGDVCAQGACSPGAKLCACEQDIDCAVKDDGNLCNGKLYCDKKAFPFACKLNAATIVSCAGGDANSCQQNTCDPGTGKCAPVSLPDAHTCTDGQACTVGDACLQGQCQPGTSVCGCKKDSDCEALGDGDLCNGTLHCALGVFPFQCQVAAATVVICDPAGDSACFGNQCAAKTGKCSPGAKADGAPCDDGNACTLADVCGTATCIGSVDACNDGDACTQDACDAKSGCSAVWAGACGDGNSCTADSCDKVLGCMHQPLSDVPCNDGKACSIKDLCKNGQCLGLISGCDDGNACTTDECGEGGGCEHNPALGSCDDLDACTLSDQCTASTCKGTPKDCSDSNPCTVGVCAGGGVCGQFADNTGTCNDGDPCTTGDNCKNQSCGYTGIISCNDGSACTTDYCDTGKGCAHKPYDTNCDDGNACTYSDKCAGGLCSGTPVVSCQPNKACQVYVSCDPAKGCLFADQDGVACTDNKACTNDICKTGTCVSVAKSCDDGDSCTTDMCSTSDGSCNHYAASNVPCTDGKFCSEGLCSSGKCVVTPKVCDANAACDEASKACKCLPFYTGDGVTCTPVLENECQNGKAQCATGAMCLDQDPGYACQCSDAATEVAGGCQATFSLAASLVAASTRAALADGTTAWLAGEFRWVGPRSGSLIKSQTATGALVSGLPEVAGPISAIIADGKGGWFIGGSLTHVSGFARQGLAHVLPDGSLDGAWLANVTGVRALAVAGNTLFVGGKFSAIGGKTRQNLAAVDTATGKVTAWTADAVGDVNALLVAGGNLWIGGTFTSIGGNARANLAVLSPSTGAVVGSDLKVANGGVLALTGSGSTILAGGAFTAVNAVQRMRVAQFNADLSLTPFNPYLSSATTALAATGNAVFIAATSKVEAYDLGTAKAAVGFIGASATAGKVVSVAVSGNTLFLGGQFASFKGTARANAAALDATTGALLAWNPAPGGEVKAIAADGSSTLLGGDFAAAPAVARAGLCATDLESAAVLPAQADLSGGKAFGYALAKIGNTLYVGGDFTQIQGQARSHFAALDLISGSVTAAAPVLNGAVQGLATWQGKLVAMGMFTTFAGATVNGLCIYDPVAGTATGLIAPIPVSSYGNGDTLQTLLVADNALYIGGNFASVAGVDRWGAAALGLPDLAVLAWNPTVRYSGYGANGTVRSFLPDGKNLWLAGYFTYVGTFKTAGLARVDAATGAVDTAIAISASVASLTLPAGTGAKIAVAGTLGLPLPAVFPGFSTFDAAQGSFGQPWARLTPMGVTLRQTWVAGKYMYLAGNFTTIGGVPQAGWARVVWP